MKIVALVFGGLLSRFRGKQIKTMALVFGGLLSRF